MSRRTKFGLAAVVLVVVAGGLFALTGAKRNKRAVECGSRPCSRATWSRR
jgi:hypothetical protein